MGQGACEAREGPHEALRELVAGNLRFALGLRHRTLQRDEDVDLRRRLGQGPQTPIAAILGCSDSRTAGNLIFDQELGRLFSVQVPGGLLSPHTLAGVEFSVECLRVPLIIVLGHTQCGAIESVVAAGNASLPGALSSFQRDLAALLASHPRRRDEPQAAYVARLAQHHAAIQAMALQEQSLIVRTACRKDRLRVVPGIYHLETGKVQLIRKGRTRS